VSIQLDPKRLDAYVSRGEILTIIGKHQDAINNYEKLIQLKSSYITDNKIFLNLAKGYLSIGDRKNAIKIWERRKNIDNSFAKFAPMGQALLFLKFKDFPRAISKFDQALEIDPQNIWAYWYRALTHEKFENQAAAINDFRQVKDFKTDFLLRSLERNSYLSAYLKEYQTFKETTARIYHIKSLACKRLNHKSCATENLKITKKLLGLSKESEINEFFSPLDTSFERVLSF